MKYSTYRAICRVWGCAPPGAGVVARSLAQEEALNGSCPLHSAHEPQNDPLGSLDFLRVGAPKDLKVVDDFLPPEATTRTWGRTTVTVCCILNMSSRKRRVDISVSPRSQIPLAVLGRTAHAPELGLPFPLERAA